MSLPARIFNIIAGFVIIVGSIVMMLIPDIGYFVISIVISVTLLVYAIKELIYYFTMARHMVGGRIRLYTGIISLDLAVFTVVISDIPKIFVMMYLSIVFGVSGVLHIMRALEARTRKAPGWTGGFIHGLVTLLVAILCGIFIRNTTVMVIIYSFGLLFSGIFRIGNAFTRTRIVYIQ